jgi:hypothetical protein
MVRKETLEFLKECVRIFDAGKPSTKQTLEGVQFVERAGSSLSNTLLFSTGAVYVEQQGSIKSSIPEGVSQYRVPISSVGVWKVGDTGNISNDVNSLYPAPQAPQLALKGTAALLNNPAPPAMSIKMLGNFVDSKYVYMEGRDIFCIRDRGETQAAWVSAAADLPRVLATPSSMTKAFVRLFSEKTDDSLVGFLSINGSYVAMQLYSSKMHVRVTHILATPSEQTIDAKFSIGKTNLRLVRNGAEFNLIKGKEDMNLDQVSQLFAAKQEVAEVKEVQTTPVAEPVKEETPAVTEQPTAPEIKEEVTCTEEITETSAEETTQCTTTATEEPVNPVEQVPVEIPLSELVANLIAQLDQIKTTVVETTKGCKEAQKRIKKLEKNPPKTALEERIKELEAELAQEKALSLKRKKALDAALAG